MRIDKLKKLLAEIRDDPGDKRLFHRLSRQLGEELCYDDFGKLREIRVMLVCFQDDMRRQLPLHDRQWHFLAGTCMALRDLLASYEASAQKTVCCECGDPLLDYVDCAGQHCCIPCFRRLSANAIDCETCRKAVLDFVAQETIEQRFCRMWCRVCDRNAKGGRAATIEFYKGTFRKSPKRS